MLTMYAHFAADADTLLPLVVVPTAVLVATRGGLRRRGDGRGTSILLALAVGALTFQVVHALEHALQLGYWILHPTDAAWLTPWAATGRDALAGWTDGRAGTGVEVLHLAGNVLFLAGLVALWGMHQHRQRFSLPSLRWATALQGAHVIEHVALTATFVVLGRASGVTTLFGMLEPAGTLGVAVRVWSHFLINAAATWFAVAAVWPALSAWAGGERSGRARLGDSVPDALVPRQRAGHLRVGDRE